MFSIDGAFLGPSSEVPDRSTKNSKKVYQKRILLQNMTSGELEIAFLVGMRRTLKLWLSKERNCCRLNYSTFHLPWARSLCCLSRKIHIENKEEILRWTVK